MTYTKPVFFLFSLILAFFVSCSQAKPEIQYGDLELVIHENGGRPVERFSFFVLPSDEDGFEDLDELWLCHDWEGLSWQFSSQDWISQAVNGQTWIGSRAIAMDDGSPLPRGQYRAVLLDKSGDRTERPLTFDTPAGKPFPVISVAVGRYRIVSEYPLHSFIAYDNEGNYLITIQLSSNEGEIAALQLPSQARSLALWAQDPEHSVSAFGDVIPLYD
jgi:hypothetical protein